MARFNTGGNVPVSNGGIFYTPNKEKPNQVFLVGGPDFIRWIDTQASCFTQNGKPCNASWACVGKDDPAHELGLQTNGYVAWVPVAVKNDSGGFDLKLWQTNRTNHAAIVEFAKEWAMNGLRMKILKTRVWTVAALPPLKEGGPNSEQLDELIGEIPTDEEFGKMIGPDDAKGVWELLMKRLNVNTIAQVRTAFGVASKAGSGSDIEVEDV